MREEEQHDDHCIMNVDYRPWRIQWIHNDQMCVGRNGNTRVADLSKIDWAEYIRLGERWYEEERARLARTAAHQAVWRADQARWAREEARRDKERGERELERHRREWQEAVRRSIGYAQLLASGYGLIDNLEREVVLVDLEDTDTETILAVDCQTFHLERLTP